LKSKPKTSVRWQGLLLSALAAPASAFLIWIAIDMALDGFPPSGLIGTFVVFIVMTTLLVTGWGVVPAAAFGIAFLFLLKTASRDHASRSQMTLAGLAASGAYAGISLMLASAGQDWVFLAAPWAVDVVNPNGIIGPGRLWTIVVSIVVSGGLAAVLYERTTRQA